MKWKVRYWFNMASVVLVISFAVWLQFRPSHTDRPPNVPKGATMVGIPYSVVWDYCWLDNTTNQNRCQIFNKGGNPLYDDVFLRYEGTGPVPQSELRIKQCAGEQWIVLENNVILIPRTGYERIRKFVDALPHKYCQ